MEYGRQYGGFALPTLTPAVKCLLILNGVMFLLNMLVAGALSEPSKGALLAISWDRMWDGYGLGALRLLSYQFTHSWADPFHLLMNMLVLYFFGTLAERSLGYRGTFKLYLLSGIMGGLIQVLLELGLGQGHIPIVGASAACFGILVYAACVAPHALVIFIIFPMRLWVLAAVLVGMGAYSQYVQLVSGSSGGTAHGAHLGGAAWGYIAHRLGWYKDYTPYVYQEGFLAGFRGGLQRRRESRRARTRARQQGVLDNLLEKVHKQGISALTGAERRFLDRASRDLKRR